MTMKKLFALIALTIFTNQLFAANLGNTSARMWSPFVEWTLNNSSFSGNPFDVIATATFSHSGSSKTHRTEMFYAGNNTWKFRFTGTRTGNWNFVTNSSDPELNGHTGTVSVSSNPNATGFLTKSGNKFAIQTGNDAALKPFRLNIYMTDYDGDGNLNDTSINAFRNNTASMTRTYARAAKNNGMSAIYISLLHNVFELGVDRYDRHSSVDPDLDTFEIIDEFITTAHSEGVHVYFWAWGDDTRRWTPTGLPGGSNGSTDIRLQRYIAARLGPLPGWSMGYGFDLHEWTTAPQRNAWANNLHSRMGWDHLLSARGARLPNGNNINGYSSDGRGEGGLDTITLGGPHTYNEALQDIQSDTGEPSLYEERHVYKRDRFFGATWRDTTSMEGTRRLIWRTTMVGGTGGWYGHFREDPVFGNAPGYSNPEQLRTAATFWDDNERFLFDMSVANNLTDGFALRNANNRNFVFYKENTSSIQMNLSSMSGNQTAIAVDTARSYSEVVVGNLSPGSTTWDAPYSSDWAIAVGSFNGSTPPTADTTPPSRPTNLIAR